METSYVALYKLAVSINQNKTELNTEIQEIICNLQTLKDCLNLDLFYTFEIREFFVIQHKETLHFLLSGNTILINGWNTEIQKLLEIYIKKNLDSDTIHGLNFQDFTYLAKNKEVKPRRLRSIGGALRRIVEDIRKLYWQEESIFPHVKFYAILGNKDKVKIIFLAVKANKKIPKLSQLNIKLSQLDTSFLLLKQSIRDKSISDPNIENLVINNLNEMAHTISKKI